YIAEQECYRDGHLGSSILADLEGPVVHDHIDKINDQPDANDKSRVAKKIPVIVCDHEIDLVDTKEHGEKCVKEYEMGAEIMDMAEHDVYDEPYEGGESKEAVKKRLPLTQKPPDMELPGQKGPFHQPIDVDNNGIVLCQ